MHPPNNIHIPISRRDFLFAAILYPFVVNAIIADDKSAENVWSTADKEVDIVILGGWVLLRDDLIGNGDL